MLQAMAQHMLLELLFCIPGVDSVVPTDSAPLSKSHSPGVQEWR